MREIVLTYTCLISSAKPLKIPKEPISSDQIVNIKDDVGTCWRNLAIKLGIKTGIVDYVEQDYRTCRERAHHILEIWKEQNGGEATVGRLACALINIGHKRIADKLLGM